MRRCEKGAQISYAHSKGLKRVDLEEIDVLIGTPDGRGRDMATGIRIPTVGEGSKSYENTLGSISHEIGHKVQEGGFANFEAFNYENERQRDMCGEKVYYTPGTLECEAQTFRRHVLETKGF